MCGIFGYVGKKSNAREKVISGLKNLEYRGYDSWGIAAIDDTEKMVLVKLNDLKSSMSFGHTRWATHGGVTDENAHPHLDCSNDLALIHNGIIDNYEELKLNLRSEGHRFKSETDSEVAVHLVEKFYDKFGFEKSVIKTFKSITGLNAIIIMDRKTRLFAAVKNGSPLIIGRSQDGNYLASDAHAIIPYTRELYFMEDGEMVIMGKSDIKIIDLKKDMVKKGNFIKVNWNISHADKGEQPHFMIKEIFDQEKIIEHILAAEDSIIKKYSDLISASFGTYLVGCGTAAYACLAGTYIFSKIAKSTEIFSKLG